MTEVHEIVVYIHGVSQSHFGVPHEEDYRALHDGIADRNADWPGRFLGVEWGWNYSPGPAEGHEQLTEAQHKFGGRILESLTATRDFTLNPGRFIVDGLRPLLIYGFSDMFYYVSHDGKRSVRGTVADQIRDFVSRVIPAGEPISLTLLGHSAGSVIAFDFAFSLFYERPRDGNRGSDAIGHGYLRRGDSGFQSARELREMARAGKLRIRRLITFGSPISMLACRSSEVVSILADGGRLDPKDYGLDSNVDGGDEIQGPRWLNLWDRDDPIAWPVEPLMQKTTDPPRVEDIYVDVSDSISHSHDSYWRSKRAHKTIAERW